MLISSGIAAMEQSYVQSAFDTIPEELNQHLVLSAVSVCRNVQEVASFVLALKLVNKMWNALIEDPRIVAPFIKKLHKKFGIRKLDARFIFHTKEAQNQLAERTQIITKYAFLHHNDLLHKSWNKLRNLGTSLVIYSLELSYQDLHEQRKNNSNFWNTTLEIEDAYVLATMNDTINVVGDAYNSPECEASSVATHLLYITENNDHILKDSKLQDHQAGKNLFSMLFSKSFQAFFPDPFKKSDVYNKTKARINVLKK